MNRRQFCQYAVNLGLFSAASSLLPWRTWAQDKSSTLPQFLILMRLDGGWDTSLCTDPWLSPTRPDEADFFIEYRQDELLPFGDSFVGPALKPLQSYFPRMTLINGIYMSATDGGHDSGAVYATTGNGQGDLGVLPLELEGRLFSSPFGTLSNLAPYSGKTSKPIWDLNDILLKGSIGGVDLLLDLNDKTTDLSLAREAILKNQNRIALFNQILGSYTDRSFGAAVATGFRSGLSSTCYINNTTSSLDSHSNHAGTHLTNLTATFDNIKALLDTLQTSPGVDSLGAATESHTLLDQTTVMIVSEFTRTPALNVSKGKDHNPQANSAIVISPRLKSTKIGAAHLITREQSRGGNSYLAGLPLDLTTQQAVTRKENTFILRPDNVVATVAKSLGVEPTIISKNFESTKILTSLFKD